MTWKNRKETFELSLVVSAIAIIVGMILAMGLFGLICSKTITSAPTKIETPVLDKVRIDVEKRIR